MGEKKTLRNGGAAILLKHRVEGHTLRRHTVREGVVHYKSKINPTDKNKHFNRKFAIWNKEVVGNPSTI